MAGSNLQTPKSKLITIVVYRKTYMYHWPLNLYNSQIEMSYVTGFAYTRSGTSDTYNVIAYYKLHSGDNIQLKQLLRVAGSSSFWMQDLQ